MGYIENPKTKGSGIICAIPQKGRCPNDCEDCFFQSGRSYLEPLEENLPNIPSLHDSFERVARINDGNDSNVNREVVMSISEKFTMKFYNTSIPKDLEGFKDPVVLTINPGKMTDKDFYKLDPIPKNLMFVRIRTNMWNVHPVVLPAVEYYTSKEVPVVLTFMAYFNNPEKIPEDFDCCYSFRKRTLNSYYAITNVAWKLVMSLFEDNKYVYSCGREGIATGCKFCGNCLREYFATMERLRTNGE